MKKKLIMLSAIVVVLLLVPMTLSAIADQDDTPETYDNLYAAVQGETNAAAAYRAFAAQAETEGYSTIARLFLVTADAESKHAEDEWAILAAMGATVRPVAAAPTVGSTADNLAAAVAGETYEYQTMYPEFLAAAQAENVDEAARIFRRAGGAEQAHAGNFADVLANLGDTAYIDETYGTLYRCIVCGMVSATRPVNCPICNASGDTFVQYNQTYYNLYASVQGETNAAAAYRAYAAQAETQGYSTIARLFLVTADAESKHAEDEWAILSAMGATVRPVAATPTVGSTADNLAAAVAGETYEYQTMYPDFLAAAQAEGMEDAARIFRRAGGAEEIHAGNYADVLDHLDDADYVDETYGTLYRCIICGAVTTERPVNCPICNAPGDSFVQYNQTYYNLYAAVQGETNAAAAYRAFADKADTEGLSTVALLFRATADAEAKHAEDEWAILSAMGATERPLAAAPTVGSTAENLAAAVAGETYEYQTMYPEFLAAAQAEGMEDAARIFRRAGRAEEIHAGNYADVLAHLGDTAYIDNTYGTLYRCVVCGEVVTDLPANCPICGAAGDTFVRYGGAASDPIITPRDTTPATGDAAALLLLLSLVGFGAGATLVAGSRKEQAA